MPHRVILDTKKLLGFRLDSRHAAGSKIGNVKSPVKNAKK